MSLLTTRQAPPGGSQLAPAVVTATFAAMLLGANLTATLYAGYATRFHFSTEVLASVFAVYALVLVPSLLVFGQLSDRLGRRPVIAIGLGLAILALVLFATATGVASLFAARAVQGLAQGMLSGAATAALIELVGDTRPRQAALMATLAQSGGSGLGVLIGGVVGEWAPDPWVTPFDIGIAVCVLALAALAAVPETSPREGGGIAVRWPHVPREIRAPFARIGLTAAAVWSSAALFLSIIPSYAGKLVVHSKNLALLAVIAALVLLASCAAQLAVRRGVAPALAQAAGLMLLAGGLLLLVIAAPLHSMTILGVAAIVAGSGHGLGSLAAQDQLTQIAPAGQRGEISAAFYVCIYLGVALPIIGIGILAVHSTLFIAVAVFAGITATAALVVALWHATSAG